jgi:hypothetical protein
MSVIVILLEGLGYKLLQREAALHHSPDRLRLSIAIQIGSGAAVEDCLRCLSPIVVLEVVALIVLVNDLTGPKGLNVNR